MKKERERERENSLNEREEINKNWYSPIYNQRRR